MKPKYIAIALAAPILFVACENPADKTEKANVKGAVEKTTETAGGAGVDT